MQTWKITLADMLCEEFAGATERFSNLVVTPTCKRLSEIEPQKPENAVLDTDEYHRRLDAREARKALALSLAGLWESHFREHMWKSTVILAKGDKKLAKEVQLCKLDRLEEIFEQLRGFPLENVGNYKRIRTLTQIANAARHGNGPSSKAVFVNNPTYYSAHKPHAGWYSHLLHGGAEAKDVRYLHITSEHLHAFSSDIVGFWNAIGELAKSGQE